MRQTRRRVPVCSIVISTVIFLPCRKIPSLAEDPIFASASIRRN